MSLEHRGFLGVTSHPVGVSILMELMRKRKQSFVKSFSASTAVKSVSAREDLQGWGADTASSAETRPDPVTSASSLSAPQSLSGQNRMLQHDPSVLTDTLQALRLDQSLVSVLDRQPVGAQFSPSGVWRLLSASWILWPGGGFVTVSVSTKKTYGIHNWHDRVSFCLPCVILTLRLSCSRSLVRVFGLKQIFLKELKSAHLLYSVLMGNGVFILLFF